MSMLSSSYTLLSLAPVRAPGKFSPAALNAPKQLVASSATLPWASCKVSRSRAAFMACHAQYKQQYNIQPIALVHPRTMGGGPHDNWSITEDKDHVTLKLDVGMSTSKENLEVATLDTGLLIIRYKGDGKDLSPASELDVRLLVPPGYYDVSKVKSFLDDGWLEIRMTKSKNPPTNIPIQDLEK